MAACKVGNLLAGKHLLTDADRALMLQWLEDGTDSRGRRVSAVQMAHAVTTGTAVPVGPTTLKDHRGGRCACYRKASA